MKRATPILVFIIILSFGVNAAVAIEEAQYEVLKKENRFEIRDYESYILAEIIVEGDIEQAGNKAFNRLFRYISGDNRLRAKVEMTAPVSQEPRGEKIKMTAPVSIQPAQTRWAVSFMMPASYTLETLPEPEDPEIIIRQVPSRKIAAVMYSGFWSESKYLQYKKKLEDWIHKEGLTIAGDSIWARYNPPFTPWFLRRNEILIPIEEKAD